MAHGKHWHAWTIFGGVIALLGITLLLIWGLYWRKIAYTTDAYVEGNKVVVTPLVNGFVTEIHTDDTYIVEKGQLLISLDETDAQIALSEAIDELGNQVRDVCQIYHQTAAYRSEIISRSAELLVRSQDYQHRIDVIEAGGVSLENLQHAIAALDSSNALLQMTKSLYEKELAKIQGVSIRQNPQVQKAAEKVVNAWVQLKRCKIHSPVKGLVAQRKVQVGMWMDAGAPMLSVIPLDQIWVNTNYKETQMKKMRIGQRVKLYADMYGRSHPYTGRIVGLPGGAGNAFSILPPQNLSGNWIKIVQRLPVRVEIDPKQIEKLPLRIGMTMRAITYLDDPWDALIPKAPEKSPSYVTSIYKTEEMGSQELIDRVIQENLDPLLSSYLDCPYLEKDHK